MNKDNFLIEIIKDLSYNFYNLIIKQCFLTSETKLKLNGRTFKIIKLLGEGGFSYVYLAEDLESKRFFALKKIRCQTGLNSLKLALNEVEAYKRFKHTNIIRLLDNCLIQDLDDLEVKNFYLFLPYYKLSVQDLINLNVINKTYIEESIILGIFLGTCKAIKVMHQYKTGPSSSSLSTPSPSSSSTIQYPPTKSIEEENDDDEGIFTGESEGEALISGGSILLDTIATEGGTSSSESGITTVEIKNGTLQPWAHRDIKPANILLTESTPPQPILMDFGSVSLARIEITTRNKALEEQDRAAEECSMPFRSPELFDVKTGTTLTESIDIWSLGCTLYAIAYHSSPFETIQQSEHGGSIAMAVLGGKFTFPSDGRGGYSEEFKELIKGCLKVKSEERWGIDELIRETEALIEASN